MASLSMQKIKVSKFFIVGYSMIAKRYFLTILLLPAVAQSQVARLDGAQGSVELKRAAAADFSNAAVGEQLFDGDIVHTSANARATLAFVDGSVMRLSENSSMVLKPVGGETHIGLDSGKAYLFSREQHKFPIVDTPSATTAIRGTELSLEVSSNETKIALLDGQAQISNSAGELLLSSGEQAVAKPGVVARKELIIKQADTVEWALPYPLIISNADLDSSSAAQILAAWNAGQSDQAFELYRKLPKGAASNKIIEAALLIGVGKVAESENLLQTLKDVSAPKLRAATLALRGVIALTKNELEAARKFAHESDLASNQSHAAALINAAVAQADFQLDSASSWLKAAAERDPTSAQALARAAELELGRGDLSAAEKLIGGAVELSPENAYVLSVRGYVSLLSDNIDLAHSYFSKAALSDSTLAEPRLGLGLVAVRRGAMPQAKEEFERAVALAPVRSLLRSYLGKAYFELQKDEQSLNEYAHALALDPNDPTPFLYRAFLKESHNDPIGALADIEASITRNDNRAVYRSRLLLDQDAAVRAASLSRTFNALGFDKIARIEAIRSLQNDYRNYSAHLLLSQSSTGILLNDAKVSEREIADLLAPPNFNMLFDQGGSSSLNEYSALFDKRESRGQIHFDGSTYDDLIAPGITYGRRGEQFGYVLSQDSILTDGRSRRSDGRLYRGHAAIEYQPSYIERIGIEGSARYDHINEVVSASSESKIEDYDVALNSATRMGAAADLLAQLKLSSQNDFFVYHDTQHDGLVSELIDGEETINPDTFLIDQLYRDRVRQIRGDLQHIWSSDLIALVSGAQVGHTAPLRRERSPIQGDSLELFAPDGGALISRSHPNLDSGDIYSYSNLKLAPWITASLGASWTKVRFESSEVPPFDGSTVEREKLNPKFGLVLTPTSSTTIRSAYFEELRKSSLEDNSSIEPSLIGGINQRFTDFSGARSRNIGLGVDQKLTSATYFGVEALHRHVVDDIASNVSNAILNYDTLTQSTSVLSGELVELHKNEDSLHSYIYQLFGQQIAASLEHDWFGFERTSPEVPQDVDLHRVRAGVRYFDRSGLYPFVQGVFRSQDRESSDFLDDGRENFTTVDAGLGYKLPHRRGNIVIKLENIFDRNFEYDQSFGVEERVHSGMGASIGVQWDF